MKKTITITIEGTPERNPAPAGDAAAERQFLLQHVGAEARLSLEAFHGTPLAEVITQLEVGDDE